MTTSTTANGPSEANPDSRRDDEHILVLGAGLAGLSASNRLRDHGRKITVLEASPHVGGLAGSFTIETEWGEFDYDNGPHRFHTGEKHLVDEVLKLLGDNICTANRQSRILLYNRFFHYPLRGPDIVKQLPKLVLIKCFWDYLVVKVRNIFSRRPDNNFENWVVNRFGRKLYDIFFGVYTEKTWGIPCSEISADWASQRISLLSLWDTVKKTLFKPKNVPRTYVSKFFYPKRGGIGTLCRSYREVLERAGAEVHTSTPVTTIHRQGSRVVGVTAKTPEGDRRFDADTVLSTIPVTKLATMFDPAAPEEVLTAVSKLKHRSMIFVYMILDREKVTDDHWIYLPEKKLTTHRLSEFKNFSKDSAPPSKTLLCAEITCNFGDANWKRTDAELQDIVVKDLLSIGLINGDEVLRTFSRREKYAYPIYDLEYRENRDTILNWIDSLEGMDTTGRQGLFKYNNMDHSIGMGLAAADNLLGQGESHRKVASGQEYFG